MRAPQLVHPTAESTAAALSTWAARADDLAAALRRAAAACRDPRRSRDDRAKAVAEAAAEARTLSLVVAGLEQRGHLG